MVKSFAIALQYAGYAAIYFIEYLHRDLVMKRINECPLHDKSGDFGKTYLQDLVRLYSILYRFTAL